MSDTKTKFLFKSNIILRNFVFMLRENDKGI